MNLSDMVDEGQFPGNGTALEALIDSICTKSMLAFAGAGVSVPLAPAWTTLLHGLVRTGIDEGFLNPGDRSYLDAQVNDDPLELASTLEEQFTRERFRSKLLDIFDLKGQHTRSHELIARLPISGIVTTNYDEGFSTAVVQTRKILPRIMRAEDRYQLNRWLHGEEIGSEQTRILHWHGNISSPDKIVLTADDYNAFYGNSENRAVMEELWRAKQLLVVGFSFKDPFLTRLAESILRDIQSGNNHFALIGYRDAEPISTIARRQFSRKYRLTPVFYRIITTADGTEDHSRLTNLLEYIAERSDELKSQVSRDDLSKKEEVVHAQHEEVSRLEQARIDFETGLLTSSAGSLLYVEPNLRRPAVLGEGEYAASAERATIGEMVSSASSFLIPVLPDSGGSTVARRLCFELNLIGQAAAVRDANDLPNYAKKLRDDDFFSSDTGTAPKVLIIDNANVKVHERLIKEVLGLEIFSRIFLIVKATSSSVTHAEELSFSTPFEVVSLVNLARDDIRVLAKQLYDTYDADLISAAVEKTYDDLLDLCIPLTPSNVIMFLSVLYKEGSFVPQNRLQIMDRYIRDLLQSSVDTTGDLLTVDHKIDILASFVFELFNTKKTSFSKGSWDKFAQREMRRSISKFNKDDLLTDLIGSKFILQIGNEYHFKYKLFYAYFLGQYLLQRHSVLEQFIRDGLHVTIDGLVEVVAGLSKDNTMLLSDLLKRAEASIEEFNSKYHLDDFDPYQDINWAITDDEQEKLWEPVIKRLGNGPDPHDAVDKVKSSLMAEQRTMDQLVIIREFTEFEQSVTFTQTLLIVALRESRGLDGALKISAMNAIMSGYLITMQIGFAFANIIAQRKYFVWNNVAFVNNLQYSEADRDSEERQTVRVVGILPRALASHAAKIVGSRRLGDLHQHMLDNEDCSDFAKYVFFASLIRSKPEGWEKSARNALIQVDRHAIYLWNYLNSILAQFHEEVNTNGERFTLKTLTSVIQAKRQLKTRNPTSSMVTRVLGSLEQASYFKDKEETAKTVALDGPSETISTPKGL